MRADARHLRHHDDGGSCAGHVDDFGDAIERDLAAREILERIVLLHGPFRHRRSSLLSMDRQIGAAARVRKKPAARAPGRCLHGYRCDLAGSRLVSKLTLIVDFLT